MAWAAITAVVTVEVASAEAAPRGGGELSMDIKRILQHLSVSNRRLRRAFPAETLARIEKAVETSEFGHLGQIQFAVEVALPVRALWQGQSAHDRAVELFAQLHVWDTEHNNGILVYLLLADRALEIVADRGIHARMDKAQWEIIASTMAEAFQQSDYETGVIKAVRKLHLHLATHFPNDHKPEPATAGGRGGTS